MRGSLLVVLLTALSAGPALADELGFVYLSPKEGPLEGGGEVLLVGAGFEPGMLVTWGGQELTGATVQGDELVVHSVPPAEQPGSVDIGLQVGEEALLLESAYTYHEGHGSGGPQRPAILSVVPWTIHIEDYGELEPDQYPVEQVVLRATDLPPDAEVWMRSSDSRPPGVTPESGPDWSKRVVVNEAIFVDEATLDLVLLLAPPQWEPAPGSAETGQSPAVWADLVLVADSGMESYPYPVEFVDWSGEEPSIGCSGSRGRCDPLLWLVVLNALLVRWKGRACRSQNSER